MGTHPIFESDFDCLTEWAGMVILIPVVVGEAVITLCSMSFLRISVCTREYTTLHLNVLVKRLMVLDARSSKTMMTEGRRRLSLIQIAAQNFYSTFHSPEM